MGASGSPEKQLTPAPQPRSAWVSARSVVVTAAHRAWDGQEGGKGQSQQECGASGKENMGGRDRMDEEEGTQV